MSTGFGNLHSLVGSPGVGAGAGAGSRQYLGEWLAHLQALSHSLGWTRVGGRSSRRGRNRLFLGMGTPQVARGLAKPGEGKH